MRSLPGLATVLVGVLGPAVLSMQAVAQNTFSIVALPDTQNYVTSSSRALNFNAQTGWIVDELGLPIEADNIVFVTHLGDIVSSGSSLTEWARADAAMSILDAGLPDAAVPYGALPGNHDYASTGNKSTGTDNYKAFFGPHRYAGYSWYLGADPSGNNHAQLFEGAGQSFLHLSMEYQPTANITNGPTRDPSPIAWAQRVIADHPGLPVLISTHDHIDDSPAGRSSAGQAFWDQLININDQVIMVLGGHHHGAGGTNDGEYFQVSTNSFGKPVVEALQDFQDYPNGGDGWLRIITFDFDAGQIRFRTYSPVLGQYQTETVDQVGPFASQFTIDMDFDARFQFQQPPEPPREIFEEVIVRQGLRGYAGTLDKELRSDGDDAGNGQNTSISVDGDDGSPGLRPSHALIAFTGLFGTGAGLPVDIEIEQAFLRLEVTNPGSGLTAWRMTVPWNENTRWGDLGGNGITPGVETTSPELDAVGADNSSENVPAGTLDLDITPAVRAWAAGNPNHGIGLVSLPSGTNGIDFGSSESAGPPALVVRRLLPGLERVRFSRGVGGYAGATDTQIRAADPAGSYGTAGSFSVDADDPSGNPNHVLIRFDDIYADSPAGPGTVAGRVPRDAQIVRAFITVNATNPGSGGVVHRMLSAWTDSVTWAGSFGGDGVQADGVEAAASPTSVVVGSTGRVDIDVTTSIAQWQASPSANLGWVILPTGGDGWDIDSSDAADPDRRPALTVIYEPVVCVVDFAEPSGVLDLFDILGFFGLYATGEPVADLDTSGAFDLFDILRFFELYAAGC